MRLTQKLAPLFVVVAAALLVLPVTSRLHQNSASANSQKQVQAPVVAKQSTSDVAGKVKKEKSQPGKPRMPKGVPPSNDDCADAIAITSCPFDSETDTGGATDEAGLIAIEDPAHINDIHATILRLMGLDHKQLTFLHDGRDERLTDVGGRVIKKLMA